METKTLLSWGYWFSAYSLGLLLHPYLTVRKIVREHFLRPLVLLPLVSTMGLWLATVVVVQVGAVVFSYLGMVTSGGLKFWLACLFWWVVWFMGMWQVVLLYLWIRFTRVLRARE